MQNARTATRFSLTSHFFLPFSGLLTDDSSGVDIVYHRQFCIWRRNTPICRCEGACKSISYL